MPFANLGTMGVQKNKVTHLSGGAGRVQKSRSHHLHLKIPEKSRLRRPNPRFSLMKVVFWALKIGIFACGALVGGRSPPPRHPTPWTRFARCNSYFQSTNPRLLTCNNSLGAKFKGCHRFWTVEVQNSKLGTSLTPHGGKGGVQKSKSPHLRAEPGGCKKKRHHTLETEGPLLPRVQGSKKFTSRWLDHGR